MYYCIVEIKINLNLNLNFRIDKDINLTDSTAMDYNVYSVGLLLVVH